ncbi:MAG: molecular chaperone [Fusobacteriota bacterium]
MKSYKIRSTSRGYKKKKFSKQELLDMSEYELKKICIEHKIIKAYQKSHGKDKLIDIILKYRGENKNLLIDNHVMGGIERVQEIFTENIKTELPGSENIKIPAKLTIYKELGISKEDMYQVTIKNDIAEGNALLINNGIYLCGIFNLIKDRYKKNVYYLKGEAKNLRLDFLANNNYSLYFFDKAESEYIYKNYYSKKELPSMNLNYYKVEIIDFEVRELEDTNTVLGIDFGTSNTSAGAFLNKNYVSEISHNDILNEQIKLNDINFTKFFDKTSETGKWIEILPTIVYVKSCKEGEEVKYLFGYDAKHRMIRNDYSGRASIFQNIKRWINNYNEDIDIYDEGGNLRVVKKRDIIKKYIEHVIEVSERQFKCRFHKLHISSPVKLKKQYLMMFQDILSEYEIEKEEALDEGMAVLYNTLEKQIQKRSFRNGKEYKALVIDCGGGTTDLSSCSFSIEKGKVAYKININTTFENGETNFGGNNLTFRILQFMKIVLAHYYKHDEVLDIDQLLSVSSGDIFRNVDEFGTDEIYKKLDEKYEEAEVIIPTKYSRYENRSGEEYQKVKNNYYFLWEIAENMKKDFFKKTNILRNKFDSRLTEDRDSDLQITLLKKWTLSVMKDNQLVDVNRFPNVVFNITEINKLIRADIYAIVKKFLEKFYESRELMEYSIIKLTGQSCKINIFKEALKEFVPGRSIEFKHRKAGDENYLDLKLSCLKGVIQYINAKKHGNIVVNIENNIPIVPYSISSYTFTDKEKILIETDEKISSANGYISKPITVEEVKFYLKNSEGDLKKEYIYENNTNNRKSVTVEEVMEKYKGKIPQKETDKIGNKEVKFFVFTDSSRWGFYILPISREDEQLYVGQEKYFPFEEELSDLNFFDGSK